MRHLTDETPKPLLKVGDRTFLDIVFDALPDSVDEIIVVIGYQGEKIKAYLGNHYKGKRVCYVIQKELNGTGGAVLLTKDYFQPGEKFLIIYGDELLFPEDVQNCLKHELSWLCWQVENPRASGIAIIENGFITEIVEKPQNPKSNLGATGLMLVNFDIFNYLPEKHETGEYYLTSMMNKFVKDHKVYAVIGSNRPSFSKPDDLSESLPR